MNQFLLDGKVESTNVVPLKNGKEIVEIIVVNTEKTEYPVHATVKVVGRNADAAKGLSPGQPVIVSGQIDSRDVKTKAGGSFVKTELVAFSVACVGGPPSAGEGEMPF